jgi:endogenous inhibitor of DNA gyrase (YacG/DUF329 family)
MTKADPPAASAAPARQAARCALCGKPQLERFKPFCSKRCSDVDLNRWLNGVYAVPAPASTDDDEEDETPPVHARPK